MFAIVALTTTPAITFAQDTNPSQHERDVAAVSDFEKSMTEFKGIRDRDPTIATKYINQPFEHQPRVSTSDASIAKCGSASTSVPGDI
jgi:hypothetical protein